MNNNSWRKFSNCYPKIYRNIEFKKHGTNVYLKCVYCGAGELVSDDINGYVSYNKNDEWRYEQDGWMFTDEVTGNEDADYWLLLLNEPGYGNKNDFYLGDRIDRYIKNIKIKTGCTIIALKPMKYDQPPEWMTD